MRKLKLTSQGEMKAQPTMCGLSLAQRIFDAIVLGLCICDPDGKWVVDSEKWIAARENARHYPL